MAFRPKRIFLAEDNPAYRETAYEALKDAGHNVVLIAENGDQARRQGILARNVGVEAAVLDCYMPEKNDGVEVARELSLLIAQILIASVSEHWSGMWQDPLYEPEHRHEVNIKNYDIHGRTPTRGPELSLEYLNWNYELLAKKIGEWEFRLESEEGMASIRNFEEMNRRRRR